VTGVLRAPSGSPTPQRPARVVDVCAVSDPDGNVVEFRFDQGVDALFRERFGTPVQPLDS
jgi:hypothetical protein